MKKYIFWVVAFFFIPLCATLACAQTDFAAQSDFVPAAEKMYLFDSNIVVHADSSITVTERLVVNAQHQQIRRGIYRDLPLPRLGKITSISLTMDDETHPFFTEKIGKDLRINFGDDNFIAKGFHTYVLKYKFEDVIDFYKDYDELYWNVTGNGWNFSIDKAQAEVVLPPGAAVQEDGISLYTGKKGEKEENAVRTGYLTFETTAPLYEEEGFTIAIPFDKGVVQPPSLLKYLFSSYRFLISFALFLFLCAYYFITWWKVGRDPFYVAVAQYEPPKGISPALVGFLRNENQCSISACAILNLAMKKIIEIKKEDKNIVLRRKTTDAELPDEDHLPPEEKAVLEQLLFPSDTCVLDRKIGSVLASIEEDARQNFYEKRREYTVSNFQYMLKGVGLWLALGIVPIAGFDILVGNLYGGILWLILFLILVSNVKSFSFKSVIGVLAILLVGGVLCFPMMMLFFRTKWPVDILCCEGFFAAATFLTALYIHLIPNVTPAGKEFYDYLKGFEKYIKVAEERRVAASNLIDDEKIFCNYLPYAFAIGMYNQWMQKFANILSAATVQKVVADAGGNETISHYLKDRVSSSIRATSSGGGGGGGGSSSHSGSHGGGHSGGGHGGGGGGGR